jgi:CHAD domain-containing protein
VEKSSSAMLSVQMRHRVAILHHKLDLAVVALTAAVTPAAVHKTRVAARRLRVFLHEYRGEFDSKEVKKYRQILKRLTRDLEAAREADVTRRLIRQLARNGEGNIKAKSRALYVRAVKGYGSAVDGLRLTMGAPRWRRGLTCLRQLSMRSFLVKEKNELAVTVMNRQVTRRRRRLHEALRRIGRGQKKLHRVRLKVKAMRYLLEACFPQNVRARNSEVTRLRRLQSCLGDIHDEENLLRTLRAERRHLDASRGFCNLLEARKNRHLHAFKRYRKCLMQLYRVTPR